MAKERWIELFFKTEVSLKRWLQATMESLGASEDDEILKLSIVNVKAEILDTGRIYKGLEILSV